MIDREKKRGERLILEKKRPVVLASIGSDVKYHLETKNVSSHGFFLEFENPDRFPFTKASMMEVWLDTGKEEPVFLNAKMIRLISEKDKDASLWGVGIAIKIVQISKENDERLKAYIEKEIENTKNKIVHEDLMGLSIKASVE